MNGKHFKTEDVLSIVTGRLLGSMDGIYEVLNYMTGESIFTHQLPRVAEEARPVILAAHPELQTVIDDAAIVTTNNWRWWRDTWVARYGPTLSVPLMTADQHERIDPLSGLAEKISPDKIIVVAT